MPAEVKAAVDGKVAAARAAVAGQDVEAIQRATQELYNEVQKVGASMYGQGGPAGPPPGEAGDGGGAAGGGEDVVEGEFKDA